MWYPIFFLSQPKYMPENMLNVENTVNIILSDGDSFGPFHVNILREPELPILVNDRQSGKTERLVGGKWHVDVLTG